MIDKELATGWRRLNVTSGDVHTAGRVLAGEMLAEVMAKKDVILVDEGEGAPGSLTETGQLIRGEADLGKAHGDNSFTKKEKEGG